MRIPIHKQREVVRRIADHPTESSRSISRAIGIAANSVLALREAYVKSELSIQLLEQLDDDQWRRKLDTTDCVFRSIVTAHFGKA